MIFLWVYIFDLKISCLITQLKIKQMRLGEVITEEVLPMAVLNTGLLNNGPPGKPYCTTLHFTSYLNVLKL